MMLRDTLLVVLQNLRFVVKNLFWILLIRIQLLGVEIDSLTMIVSFPLQKKEQIILKCQDLLNQSDVSLRQMIDRLSSINSNSCSSSTFSVLIFSTSTNSRVRRKAKIQCTNSVIRRNERENSVVNRKPDAAQREGSNLTSHSIDQNFTCLSSVLGDGGSLLGTNNGRSIDSRGTEKPYKYIWTEGGPNWLFQHLPVCTQN